MYTAKSQMKRKYPRLQSDLPAEMEIAVVSSRFGRKQVTVPVTVKSIAPEGLGLATIGTIGLDLTRGRNVRVRFKVGRDDIELPARIAWSGSRAPGVTNIDLGIQLHLPIAPAQYRHAYAEWFVNEYRREAGLPPSPPS